MGDENTLVFHGASDNWPDPKENVGAYLLRRLQGQGERILQTYDFIGKSVSCATLVDWSSRYAAVLRSRGVQPGDVVVVCCAAHPHMPALLLGTLIAGATFAPVNHNFDAGDLELLLGVLQPRMVFSLPQTAERLCSVQLRLQNTFDLVLLGEGASWGQFLRDSQEIEAMSDPVEVKDLKSHLATVMCSSGTTGLPKGVCLSHYNLHAMLHMMRRPDSMVSPDDIVVITSPTYWVTGVIFTLSAMDCGTKLVHVFGATPEQFLDAIMKHKATTAFAASNFLLSVAKHPSLSLYDLSSLRYLTCGGASMSEESQLLVENRMGAPVYQWYGMTEMLVATGTGHRKHHKPGSVGQLSPYVSCRVVNAENGQVMGRGFMGELQFRGAMLGPGYLRNPEATAATINSAGWLCSGDVGFIDEDDYLFVTGRIKDLIKYRGDHIAPVELETILLGHSGVQDVAVVAVPHDTDQELPRAYVVRQLGSKVTAEELEQLVAGQVAPHKWLRGGVHFLDDLPKSPTGKTSRAEIRRLYVQPSC